VTYGRAAKLIAVYLKALVMMGDGWNSLLGQHMHPPIDRILPSSLAASKRITSPYQTGWRSISWTRLNETRYDELISQLRTAIPDGAPFWTIEEFWQPSDIADDVP